jgi:ABC-type lipoprotein release transport system permease subunit
VTEKGTKNQDFNVKTMKGFKEVSPEYKAISRKEVFREFWASARSQKRIFFLLLFFVVLQGGGSRREHLAGQNRPGPFLRE